MIKVEKFVVSIVVSIVLTLMAVYVVNKPMSLSKASSIVAKSGATITKTPTYMMINMSFAPSTEMLEAVATLAARSDREGLYIYTNED